MRKVDFGEQLVEETIEEVIQNADARIKSCPLDPVEISTYICTVGGEEYPISNQKVTSIMESVSGEIYFNKLVLNNVLAGRIQLFNYNSNFTSDYNEASLSTWGSGSHYDLLYPSEINEAKTNGVYQIYSNFFIRDGSRNVKLTANEIVQFRMPSLKTEQTYPAYVNYYFKGTPKTGAKVGIPATMRSLLNYLNSDISAADPAARYAIWESAAAHVPATEDADVTAANFNNEKAKYKALFIKDANDVYKYANAYVADETYYYLPINNTTFASWAAWVTNIEYDEAHNKLSGIFYAKPSDYSLSYGKYIDRQHIKYIEITAYRVEQDPFSNYYIQLTHDDDYHPSTANPETWYTKDGLGQDADVTTLNANEEHLLAPNEFLLINYTHATSTEGSNKTVINRYIGPGNIIKPSFALADSQEYRTTHSYTKTSGFGDFRDDNGYIVTDPEVVNIKGMFTLGTNEQIE